MPRTAPPLVVCTLLTWLLSVSSTETGSPSAWLSRRDRWARRGGSACAVFPTGQVLVLGGEDGARLFSDVWRSDDSGVSWTLLTAFAPWWSRSLHASAVLPNATSTVLILGGRQEMRRFGNDVWESVDGGYSWAQVCSAAAWSRRAHHSVVARPTDGVMLVMGGWNLSHSFNDVWRSGDDGRTWSQVVARAPWSARRGHSSVALRCGDVILMGGEESRAYLNDVWRLEGSSESWVMVHASAPWQGRSAHTTVLLPGGQLVLAAGLGDFFTDLGDVWSSHDGGATWRQMSGHAPWGRRSLHMSAGLPNGEVLVLGGSLADNAFVHDVWRSADAGLTWYDQPTNAPWEARHSHTTVTLRGGAVLLVGGFASGGGGLDDAWRSEDEGASWARVEAGGAELGRWGKRGAHSCVVLPTGDILLMGGQPAVSDDGALGDVWRSSNDALTWLRLAEEAAWGRRHSMASVAVRGGPVLVMGGASGVAFFDDVWRTDDGGLGWHQVTRSPQTSAWSARAVATCLALSAGTLVLVGGYTSNGTLNEIWTSADLGRSWNQAPARMEPAENFTELPPIGLHASVVLADDTMLIVGGGEEGLGFRGGVLRSNDQGETWEFVPAPHTWDAREGLAATVLSTGDILLVGGADEAVSFNDAWRSRGTSCPACIDHSITWVRVHQTPGDDAPGSVVIAPVLGDTLLHIRFPLRPTSVSLLPLLRPVDIDREWVQVLDLDALPHGLDECASVPLTLQLSTATSPQQGVLLCGGRLATRELMATCWWIGGSPVVSAVVRCGRAGIHNAPEGPSHCGWDARQQAVLASLQLSQREKAEPLGPYVHDRNRHGAETAPVSHDIVVLYGGMNRAGAILTDLWVSTSWASTWHAVASPAPPLGSLPAVLGAALALLPFPGPEMPPACRMVHEQHAVDAVRVVIAGGITLGLEVQSRVHLVDVCIPLTSAGLRTGPSIADVRVHIRGGGNYSFGYNARVVALPNGRTCVGGALRALGEADGSALLECTRTGEEWAALAGPQQHAMQGMGVRFGLSYLPVSQDVVAMAGSRGLFHSVRSALVVRSLGPVVASRALRISWSSPLLASTVLAVRVQLRCAFANSTDLIWGWSVSSEDAALSGTQLVVPVEALHCPRSAVRVCVLVASAGRTEAPSSLSEFPDLDGPGCGRVHTVLAPWRVEVIGDLVCGSSAMVTASLLLTDAEGCWRITSELIPWQEQVHPVPTQALSYADTGAPFCNDIDRVVRLRLSLPLPSDLTLHAAYAVRTVLERSGVVVAIDVAQLPVERGPLCPAGQFADAEVHTCRPCAAGFHSPEPSRLPHCAPCTAGRFAPRAGQSSCGECGIGAFLARGSTGCSVCPDHTTTTGPGQSSCGCEGGSVLVASSTSAAFCCEACDHMPDLNCTHAFNASLAQIRTRRGWWRSPENPFAPGDMCLASYQACVGGPLQTQSQCEARAGGAGEPGQCNGCAVGHNGVLCMECGQGWVRASLELPGTLPCMQCDHIAWRRAVVAVIAACGASLLTAYLMLTPGGAVAAWRVASWLAALAHAAKSRDRHTSRPARVSALERAVELRDPLLSDSRDAVVGRPLQGPFARATRFARPALHVDVMLWLRSSMLMVQTVLVGLKFVRLSAVAGVQVAVGASTPALGAHDATEDSSSSEGWMNLLLLNVQAIVDLGCAVPGLSTPMGRLLVSTAGPLLLEGACLAAARRNRRLGSPISHDRAMYTAVMIATLTAANAQAQALWTYACRWLHSTQSSRLLGHPTIECWKTPEHMALASVAACALLAHCVAYPVLLFVLLRRAAQVGHIPAWLRPATVGMAEGKAMLEVVEVAQRALIVACFVFGTQRQGVPLGRGQMGTDDPRNQAQAPSPSPVGALLAATFQLGTVFALLHFRPFSAPHAQSMYIISHFVTVICMVQLATLPHTSHWLASADGVHGVLAAGVAMLGVAASGRRAATATIHTGKSPNTRHPA